MTSELGASKTNEFLRRRKLRLQQVREQSKDIAKKIRQRAKVENLRQVIELDSKKKKDYLEKQQKLIKKLEEYYNEGIENVGSSHRIASEVQLRDAQGDHIDPSKKRGREAAAELRKKRQEVLDKQKEILDRKLQAREVANEISRDKSAIPKLLSKPEKVTDEEQHKLSVADSDKDGSRKDKEVARNDMATQWDLDEMPLEWEPNIPALSLPKDDNSVKESNNNNVDSKSDKSKRLDLFALSEEMPSSLRGSQINQEERPPVKSSLTLVSEYLQNRDLRLRKPDVARTSKTEDMQSLKQTILRTRTSKEVSGKCETISKQFKTAKSCAESIIPKKSLVTMYNHATRDSRDIPYCDERLVVRNSEYADDAYLQAMKESTSNVGAKDSHKKVQEIRSKVAMSKQNVEKEYRDTIAFLNALPKDMENKPNKTAYMDGQQQQMQKNLRQQKLQQEYTKITKECSKRSCKNKSQSKSVSPTKRDNDIFDSSDFQYSWMPVPESDGNLAIHTIPTTLKEGKSNSVKFSKIDSYHEYRSRHKHTPPTKQTATDKPNPEVAQLQIDSSSSDSESSSVSSDRSIQSVRLVKQDMDNKKLQDLSDAERIVVYKILDSKADDKKTSKLMKSIAKSLTRIESKTKCQDKMGDKNSETKLCNSNGENIVSFEQLNEGVYRTVNEKGDNIASMCFRNREEEFVECKNDQKRKQTQRHSPPLRNQSKPPEMESAPSPLDWNNDDNHHLKSRSTCGAEGKTYTHLNVEGKTIDDKFASIAQPSAATSATSFKTATTNRPATSEGNFVKLIDEAGQETGKLFIGATGLLNNDAYEVVIQLRKKGDEKDIVSEKKQDKKDEALGIDKITVVSSTQTSLGDLAENVEHNKISVAVPSDIIEPEREKAETPCDSVTNVLSVEVTEKPIVASPCQLIESVTTSDQIDNKFSENGVTVGTAVNGSNTQNVFVSHPIPTPRPATSTYTQTSMLSPNHRPPLFHMSSSASTAYMSPPEIIIPKFMRRIYHQLTDEEMKDQRNSAVDGIKIGENAYSAENNCDCRRCLRARRLTLTNHVHTSRHRCSKSKVNAKTPPNSVRSKRSAITDHFYHNQICQNTTSNEDAEWIKESRCKCSKCLHHKKSKHSASGKLSARNLSINIPSSIASSKNNQKSSKRSKTSLKPLVKSYVDKLLLLNKESLKAIQIVDQECSSVTTPSSSVIDVPNNMDKDKPNCEKKLSLQKIKVILKQKVTHENEKKLTTETGEGFNPNSHSCYRVQGSKNKRFPKLPRKNTAHKVKSLNISKKVSKIKASDTKLSYQKPDYSSSSPKNDCERTKFLSVASRTKLRSKSSPTPRLNPNSDTTDSRSAMSDLTSTKITIPKFKSKFSEYKINHVNLKQQNTQSRPARDSPSRPMTSTSNDSDRNPSSLRPNAMEAPMTISTQTSINVDSDVHYIKLAEDKLQNMEKIADLTEKCTKRLSNLAKVLEEVRKNKTLAYSHITTSDISDSDQKSDKDENKVLLPQESINVSKQTEINYSELSKKELFKESDKTGYVPFLSNIPKPVLFKSLNSDLTLHSSANTTKKSSSSSSDNENVDLSNKHRSKPPPALSRINLKRGQDLIVPHELSTVVEVDSPLSVRLKSSRNMTKLDAPDSANSRSNTIKNDVDHSPLVELKMGDTNNPDLLDCNEISYKEHKKPARENSKIQMIDIEQFNEIMLKPFFSIQEYARQCNIGTLDDGSNVDDIIKDDQMNDDLSSLHSEASLPDVISELLKRNIISEPFKFDSGSNVNSTTVSSESTISVLALSRAKQGRHRSSSLFHNKDNVGETSDTMSFSSNPDLENAFKKLGMGWASSTLKKTKERLALSSSSNTSSSSLSQFRAKCYNQDVPAPVTDTVSSVMSLPDKAPLRKSIDNSKNAEQQTSKTKSMTVKEFLTKELSKKITFDNKTQDAYVTLYETKMPEEMNHSSLVVREENCSNNNSLQSGNNNRARTSTPVQLYKSIMYQSSSSSNVSNGLFSNVEDLSSVKATSNSMKHSTSDKDDLIIPNLSLRVKKPLSDNSKSD